MNPYSPNTLAGVMPWLNNVCVAVDLRAVAPHNPDQIAPYQKCMQVVFLPSLVHDLKRLAAVDSVHALFTAEGGAAKLAVSDRAYLIAFNTLVVKALNLAQFAAAQYQNSADMAVRLSQDKALIDRIELQYFHQHIVSNVGVDVQSTECTDHLGHSVNYVVLAPGALTTCFESGCAPPVGEMLATACTQQLAILRECLKPFNQRSTKESIAMCDPSGTYSAYLALLSVV